MSERFNTVETEVICWKAFVLDDQIYPLDHLNAHWTEYVDDRDTDHPIPYRFIVTYGLHCFTKEVENADSEQSRRLIYISPRESRPFNFDRYTLSKQLPDIIRSLGQKNILVCHAGYGSFATVKVVDSRGIEIDYWIVFVVFREKKKFRLHVTSAYPKSEGIGKIKKVNFFTIASNLLKGKALPKRQK